MAFLYDPRVRGWVFQAAVLAVLAALGWWMVQNFLAARGGVALRFDFLDNVAGFPIAFKLIEYRLPPAAPPSTYLDALLIGLLNTLFVSAVGIVLATMLGFVIGVARLSPNWLISRLAAAYVEIVRNVPLLLQMLFIAEFLRATLPQVRAAWGGAGFYLSNRGLDMPSLIVGPGGGWVFAGLGAGLLAAIGVRVWARAVQDRTGRRPPDGLIGLALILGVPVFAYFAAGMPLSLDLPIPPDPQGPPGPGRFNFTGGVTLPSAFFAVLIALVIYTASYIAEIVRSGIEGVSKGQSEAAAALGLTRGQRLSLVVIPQAMRIIVPPLTSQYLNLTKNSSLAYALAYPDLFGLFARTGLNQTGRAVEIILIIAGIYLTLSLITSLAMNIYNSRAQLRER